MPKRISRTSQNCNPPPPIQKRHGNLFTIKTKQTMKIYSKIQEVCKRHRNNLQDFAHVTQKDVEFAQKKINEELFSMQGTCQFYLTADQVAICKAIEKARDTLRPALAPMLAVENGQGILYVTNGHALAKIHFHVENPSAQEFFAFVDTFQKGMNQVSIRPVDQIVPPADFECVIPTAQAEHLRFICAEAHLNRIAKAASGKWARLQFSVKNEAIYADALSVSAINTPNDLEMSMSARFSKHYPERTPQDKEYVFNLAPAVMAMIFVAANPYDVEVYQEEPLKAVAIRRPGVNDVFVIMSVRA